MGHPQSRKFMIKKTEEIAWERIHTEPRLARDDVHAPGIGHRRLQLIVAPPFGNAFVWEIRQAEEWQLICPTVLESEPALRVVGHDRLLLSSTLLASFFERVASITVPLRPDMSGYGGLDGTVYELALFGDLFSCWRFRWWSEGPEQWRPLADIANEMHSCFSTAGHFIAATVAHPEKDNLCSE